MKHRIIEFVVIGGLALAALPALADAQRPPGSDGPKAQLQQHGDRLKRALHTGGKLGAMQRAEIHRMRRAVGRAISTLEAGGEITSAEVDRLLQGGNPSIRPVVGASSAPNQDGFR